MKQVHFKELELGSKKIVSIDASCINRVILTTTRNNSFIKTIDGYINYYWLEAELNQWEILCPTLYKLTKEEKEVLGLN